MIDIGVRSFLVEPCKRSDISDFVEKWHYSKSINGIASQYCFSLKSEGELIGAMIYGTMAMHNQWKRFSQKKYEVIELRRLCCIDDTPKNTESYFIGKTLRWLSKNTNLKIVVSYADMEHGHSGIIYKASNFKCLGNGKGADVIIYKGKSYHDKTIRTKYKGELKPFAKRIKDALESGEAFYKKTAGKVTYVYDLK